MIIFFRSSEFEAQDNASETFKKRIFNFQNVKAFIWKNLIEMKHSPLYESSNF